MLIPNTTPPQSVEQAVSDLMAPYFAELRVPPWKRYLADDAGPDWCPISAMREHYGVPHEAPLEALVPHVRDWTNCPPGCEPGIDDGGLYTWSDFNPRGEWDSWEITEMLSRADDARILARQPWMVLTSDGVWHKPLRSPWATEDEEYQAYERWVARVADLLRQHRDCLAVGVKYHW